MVKYKRIFSVWVFCSVLISAVEALGDSPKHSKFCEAMFGSDSYLTLEPIESNRGNRVSHNVLTGETTVEKPKDQPTPIGFFCAKITDKQNCPKEMQLNKKRSELPICISSMFELRELCPNEIDKVWPTLKDKICKEVSGEKTTDGK